MNVSSYIFQSPYSSQIQIGRLDPSTQKETSATRSGDSSLSVVNTTAQKAQTFEATQTKEVKASVESTQLLDIYA